MQYRKGTLLRDEVGSSLEYEGYCVTIFSAFFFCMFSYSARQNFLYWPGILGYAEEILDTTPAH